MIYFQNHYKKKKKKSISSNINISNIFFIFLIISKSKALKHNFFQSINICVNKYITFFINTTTMLFYRSFYYTIVYYVSNIEFCLIKYVYIINRTFFLSIIILTYSGSVSCQFNSKFCFFILSRTKNVLVFNDEFLFFIFYCVCV